MRLTKRGEFVVASLYAIALFLILGTGGAIETQGFTWGTLFWAALALGVGSLANSIENLIHEEID